MLYNPVSHRTKARLLNEKAMKGNVINMVSFYPLTSPVVVLWDGYLGDGVVHNEALGVFSTLWLHTGLLRGMPNLCVQSGNTHTSITLSFS